MAPSPNRRSRPIRSRAVSPVIAARHDDVRHRFAVALIDELLHLRAIVRDFADEGWDRNASEIFVGGGRQRA